MDWNNISLIVLGLAAFGSAFVVALWISLVIWTFRDMRARSRDAFAQLLSALMVLVLGPLGALLYLLLRPRESLAEKYERSLEEEALLQDIEERTICPACKQPIEHDYQVCPVCHTKLRQPCTHCGRLIHPRWSICPYCAQSQAPAPSTDRAARVTLLDLEREETAALAEPAAVTAVPLTAGRKQAVVEPKPVQEPAATPPISSRAAIEFAAPMEPEWEELDIDDFELELDDPELEDITPQTDEAIEPEPEDHSEDQNLLSSLFKN